MSVRWRSIDLDRVETAALDRMKEMEAAGREDVESTFPAWVHRRYNTYLRDLGEARQALKERCELDMLARAREVLETVYDDSDEAYVHKTLSYQLTSGKYDAPEGSDDE